MTGLIAICEQGVPGIITADAREQIDRDDGLPEFMYAGVGLLDGGPWYSHCPRVIGRFSDLLSSEQTFVDWAAEQLGLEPDDFLEELDA